MNILSNLRTREDLEYLASDLEELRLALYKGKAGEQVDIPAFVKKDFEVAPDKGKYLESVRQQILSARILELTVSGYLDDAVLGEVSAWVKKNIGEDVILSVKIDREVLAGAKISFGGKFEDCSLKDQLDKAIESIKI